jgi:membrane protease YdiL (CAAX protease family)
MSTEVEIGGGTASGDPPPAPGWGPGDALLGILYVVGLFLIGGLLIYPLTGSDGLDAQLGGQAVLELALVAVAVGFARAKSPLPVWQALGLRKPRRGWISTAAAGYGIYFLFVIAIVALLGQPEQSDVADRLGFDENAFAAVAAAALIVFIVPFCEELFFRGFFFGGMRRRLPFPVAAVISALLFGAVHLGDANLIAGLQLAFLGLVLATVYERTGSLWSNIAIHAVNNGIAFALLVST